MIIKPLIEVKDCPNYIPFIPRPYQLEFYNAMDNGCKRYFGRWTRRSGKDLKDWNFVIRESLKVIGNYYYVFPEYTQAKKAIWEGKTKNGVRYLDYIPPGYAKFNSNELRINMVNGSIIRLIGSEDIHKLRGAGPRGIVISEFAWQSMEVIEVLEPMLLENGGWLVINSTPHGKNFMYDFEQTIRTSKEWIMSEIQSLWPDLPNYYPVITSLDLDNKYFKGEILYDEYLRFAQEQTMQAIENLRKQGRTEDYIEQEYGVSYIAGQKGAFYADCIKKARDEGRIGSFPYINNQPVDVFFDLGVKDDTVMWFRQQDGDKIKWIDYYESNNNDLFHYIKILKEKGYSYKTFILPHDGGHRVFQTGMTTRDLLYRMLLENRLPTDIYVCERPSSKFLPIMLTRERFPRYFFNQDTCMDGLTKLSLYHREYDKRQKVFKESPAHDWTSHAADGIALDGMTGNKLDYNLYVANTKYVIDFNPLTYGSDIDAGER